MAQLYEQSWFLMFFKQTCGGATYIDWFVVDFYLNVGTMCGRDSGNLWNYEGTPKHWSAKGVDVSHVHYCMCPLYKYN